MEKLRYGVIGTSPIATQYITATKTTQEWALTAIYSRTQETGAAFAAQHGVDTVYTDLQAFAASDLFDAVYIASPNMLHYQQCKLMLENGKHVICEKPFASYPWQLEELFALVAQKNLVIMEAIIYMHQPSKKALEAAVAAAGDVSLVTFDNSSHSPQYDRVLAGEYPNVFDPALHAGCLMDMGIYCVYPALALFGRPSSFVVKSLCLPMGTDASGVVIFEYPDKLVTLHYSKIDHSGIGSEILGNAGRISIGSIMDVNDIVLHAPDGTQTPVWGSETKTERMANEAVDFARYILNPEDAAVQAEYQYCKDTSLLACEYLAKIRKETGLSF